MILWRNLGALALAGLVSMKVTTCRSPGQNEDSQAEPRTESAGLVELPGVDTSELTTREQRTWSASVQELLAPCPDQPVSLVECIQKKRDCVGCVPAAEYIATLVRRGLSQSQVDVIYRARFSPESVQDVKVGSSPAKGPDDAPVTVVEWADFECSACRAYEPVVERVLEKYAGQVRFVFKNFPLRMHPHAETAARAVMAAREQGKFWPMYSALFDSTAALDRSGVLRMVEELELDEKKFVTDWESEPIADAVNADRKQGERLQIQGTPSFFINGRLFVSTGQLEQDLEEWIALEIKLKTGKSPRTTQKAPGKSKAVPAPSASSGSADGH